MGFDHDIFISYSHLDNEAPFPGDPGWISFFHQVLEKRVAQLAGKKLKIWRDPDLKGNDIFPEKLAERVKNAAAFICVISKRYVESDWCNRELSEFAGAAGKVVVEGAGKARVFKVVKRPQPEDKLPQPVQPLLGYDFFKVDPESKRIRELDVSIEPELKKEYWARLDDLANDITELLELLEKERSETPAADAAATPSAGGTVYLAETTLDLQDARDELKRDLQRHGYSVLPDQALPLAAQVLEDFVREQLGRAQLVVHLVGAGFGVVPEGTTHSVVGLQNEVAAELAAEGRLRRLVWMPPKLEPKDDRQREFVEELRDDERTYERSDLLEVPLEDLKTHLYKQLEEIAKRAEKERLAREKEKETKKEGPAAGAVAGGEVRQVYLVCDQRDLDAVAPLEDHLFDQGFEVVLPVFDGDESTVHGEHTANLTVSDAFLFYYGAGGRQWIRNQLRELQKSRGYDGKKREVATAVYVAGPADSEKERFRTHHVNLVVKEGESFDPEVLGPFVEKVKNG